MELGCIAASLCFVQGVHSEHVTRLIYLENFFPQNTESVDPRPGQLCFQTPSKEEIAGCFQGAWNPSCSSQPPSGGPWPRSLLRVLIVKSRHQGLKYWNTQ